MKTFVVKTDFLPSVPHGWGNGYVIIPPGHPAHGKDYDDINVDVHGGLTFAVSTDEEWTHFPEGTPKDHWCVGFDTGHSWDTIEKWPKEAVEAETQRLKEQLEAMVSTQE